MFEREIHKIDVINAINNGKILEEYPNDYLYPSCLILGENMHIVCGIGKEYLYIITVYYPDEGKFEDKVRRK